MNTVLEKIQRIGIVPVVVLKDAANAAPLAQALQKGGLPCAEITYRTEAAEESIRTISRGFPNMLVGAGTVLTTKQVDTAVAAGAKFIVSPGLNPQLVTYCKEKGIPIVPGIATPSEMEQAIQLGLKVVKFFPAEALGGVGMIKAISAPYSQMMFMPTGGINLANLNSYLDCPNVLACGGSWMVKSNLIESGNFSEITKYTHEAVITMLGFELAHVGVNCENEEEADHLASFFGNMFGMEKKAGKSSIFAGTVLEAMKAPYLGAKGHIAIRTNSVIRAVNYMENLGIAILKDTAKYDAKGNMKCIYLQDEIGGFAVHLVQK